MNHQTQLNHFFNTLFRILVGVIAIWTVYVISSLFFAPAPYELTKVSPNKVIQVCPGDTFEYQANVTVRRTPITLVRTDSWFSEQTSNSVIPDRYETMEVFNWDKNVKSLIPRTRKVTMPKLLMDGNSFSPGYYRYIVHLNAWGEKTPASITVHIKVPTNCS